MRARGEVEAPTTGPPIRRLPATQDFAGVSTWIFDLDGTLYPSASGVEETLLRRVVLFLGRTLGLDPLEAEAAHRDYFARYGATLPALVQLHGVDPAEFLDFVHDVDLSCLSPDAELAASIEALPGRKLVFTNGSRRHAEAVLATLGLAPLFDGIGHIESSRYVGKPNRSAYDGFLSSFAVEARFAAMFEDRAKNLVVPHELGMRTVLVVAPDAPSRVVPDGEVVDVETDDLSAFLAHLAATDDRTIRRVGAQPIRRPRAEQIA